jgi:lipid-A-disaccharide synthase-like uncharacterized protein
VSALIHWLSTEHLWLIFGTAGLVVFNGRFYVQWLASEREKRSVIPVAFWYMSAVGSLMQFVYAVHLVSPGAAFGNCFNIVIYSRNLIFIWREKGVLTRRLHIATYVVAIAVALTATGFMVATWIWEFHANRALESNEAARNWFWLGVWGVGQALFFMRFLIQWLVTEKERKSVVPPVFWYLSLVAAILQGAAFSQRREWIFAIGMAATLFIYARNLWFIRRQGGQNEATA